MLKLFTFRAEMKEDQRWRSVAMSNGGVMLITLTTNDGSALNTGCKPDFRWVLQETRTIYAPGCE